MGKIVVMGHFVARSDLPHVTADSFGRGLIEYLRKGADVYLVAPHKEREKVAEIVAAIAHKNTRRQNSALLLIAGKTDPHPAA